MRGEADGEAARAALFGERAVQRLRRGAVRGADRLVEQQHVGRHRERARHGDALHLAVRQLVAAAVEQAGDAEPLRHGSDYALSLYASPPPDP